MKKSWADADFENEMDYSKPILFEESQSKGGDDVRLQPERPQGLLLLLLNMLEMLTLL